jgi:hypothetical protein
MRTQKHMSINQKMQLSLNVNRFRPIVKKNHIAELSTAPDK